MPRKSTTGTAISVGNRRHSVGFAVKAEQFGCAEVDRQWRAWYRRKFNAVPPTIGKCVVGSFEVYDDSLRVC